MQTYWLERMAALDEKYHPFIKQVEALVKQFDTQAIVALIPLFNSPPLIPPSAQEMETLLDLARRGNMSGIAKRAKEIAEADERLKPFSRQLGQLAKQFDEAGVETMIEQYME